MPPSGQPTTFQAVQDSRPGQGGAWEGEVLLEYGVQGGGGEAGVLHRPPPGRPGVRRAGPSGWPPAVPGQSLPFFLEDSDPNQSKWQVLRGD